MPIMGSDWSWTLALPGGTVTPTTIELLLAVAGGFGLSPHRPDGGINGFDNTPGREGEHRVLDRGQLVQALAEGSWSTNLWTRAEDDIRLSTKPGSGNGWDSLDLSLDACYCRRTPDARAEPFRQLHRLLTELWITIADETGALFGRVEDEWSLEQIWNELPDPLAGNTPPAWGAWPDWLSWWTYFDADHHRLLAPVTAGLDADVRRSPGGATVIALLTDPAAVDEVRFARLNQEYRRAIAADLRRG
ncbi:hypothetical protein SAMN05421837_11445 [Amycolatopsis pretoriensis]|uniref:Uncharacterized protein n=1 Tax=Amycolatopsis pretoriensis TaxID=218821 RepID=A0A1H5RGI6_9PSEU|nr:hypothetical protein [Amycolatopsis pretoriensis]SEF37485.1 hypothetical protein SAMN05421837_11445 [Amycolatopsis pretoriensis]